MTSLPTCIVAAAAKPSMLASLVPLIGAVLSFFGVLLGFWWTQRRDATADRRARLQRETSARSVVYAQLRRIHATTRQQLAFVDGPDEMIWLTIHRSLFPKIESLARLEPLTALEVDAVTSFYYLYQEQISFLTASAMEVWSPEMRATMETKFNLETDVVGFDFSEKGRKDSLVHRLTNINKSADEALQRIRAAIEAGKNDFPGLFELKTLEEAKLKRSAPAPQR